jgi:hypothetical protein
MLRAPDHSVHRAARRGDLHSAGPTPLGRRTLLAWLTGYRRLTLRYERSARLFTAFLTLATTLTCDKKLTT